MSTRTVPRSLCIRVAVVAGVAASLVSSTPIGQAASESKAPTEFVALSSVDPTIIQEMRYTTTHNFVGSRIDGYQQPICMLTRPAAEALHRAQVTLLAQGYSLKVYDCYRPQ